MKPDHKVVTRYGYDQIDAVDTPDEQTAIVRFKEPFAPWAILFDVIMPKHILGDGVRLQRLALQPAADRLRPVQGHREHQGRPHHLRGVRRLPARPTEDRPAVHPVLRQHRGDGPGAQGEGGRPDLGVADPEHPGAEGAREPGHHHHRPAGHRRRAVRLQRGPKQVPLFADKELRQALVAGGRPQDDRRQAPVRPDHASRAATGTTRPGRTPSLKLVEYDPEQAKQILDKLGWKPGSGRHPRQGRPEARLHPHHHDRQPAPRERPAAGPAELQGRRRRDDDQERAQQPAVRQLLGGRPLGARRLPDGRLVAGASPCPIRTSRRATFPRRSRPTQNPAGARSTATRTPRSTPCSARQPPSSIRRSARRSSSRSRR